MNAVKFLKDPRTVSTFSDVLIPASVLGNTPFKAMLPLQKKILAVTSSDMSVLARSHPNTGKTSAAVLSMLKTCQQVTNKNMKSTTKFDSVANLVLVPSPALADQYLETMHKYMIPQSPDELSSRYNPALQVLYRNGTDSAAEDEGQHRQLVSKHKNRTLNTLITTPNRLLDYLSYDKKWMQSVSNVSNIVIDELDTFQHANPTKTTPMETLLEFVLALNNRNQNTPQLHLLSNKVSSTLNFAKLQSILTEQASSRYIYDISEPDAQWDGTIHVYDREGKRIHELAQATPVKLNKRGTDNARVANVLKSINKGPGLILIPSGTMSPAVLQQKIVENGVECPVARVDEVSGLDLENIERIYLVAEKQRAEVIDNVKWYLNGKKELYVLFLDVLR